MNKSHHEKICCNLQKADVPTNQYLYYLCRDSRVTYDLSRKSPITVHFVLPIENLPTRL